MKEKLTTLFFILIIFVVPTVVAINCGDTWQTNGPRVDAHQICDGAVGIKKTYTASEYWTVF